MADHPGGGEDRPLRASRPGTVLVRPDRAAVPIANEELFWGDAGIGLSIMGTTLAVAGIYASGTPDQLVEWVPQCYGTPEEPQVGAFCSSEPDAGSDVSAIRTSARYDAGQGRMDPQRPEGMGDQRRDRRRPRRDRQRGSRAGLARARGLRRPARGEGARAGDQGEEARPAGLSHGGCPPGRLPGAGLVPARRQGEAARSASPARVRARDRAARRRCGPSRSPGRRSARRPSESRAPRTSTRWSTRSSGSSSGGRSSRIRRLRSRSPT